MNENAALLNDIYRISQTGEMLVRRMSCVMKDITVRKHLTIMLEAYQSMNLQSLQLLHKYGLREKELTGICAFITRMNMKRKAKRGDTPSRAAQIMLQVSTKNIIALTKSLHARPNAHPDAHKIAKRMLHIEELHVTQLKAYL